MANEKRLIDANDLWQKTFVCDEVAEVRKFIEKAPTVDAVEVVRCKDCRHWECWRNSGEGTGDCLLDEDYAKLATQHYDFCSYGERRTDNGC